MGRKGSSTLVYEGLLTAATFTLASSRMAYVSMPACVTMLTLQLLLGLVLIRGTNILEPHTLRPGVDHGIILGVAMCPLVFASQYLAFAELFPESLVLFWLSVTCSFVEVPLHIFPHSRRLSALLTASLVVAVKVLSGIPSLAVVATNGVFYVLNGNLHRLMPRSFSRSEAITIATLFSLVIVQAGLRTLRGVASTVWRVLQPRLSPSTKESVVDIYAYVPSAFPTDNSLLITCECLIVGSLLVGLALTPLMRQAIASQQRTATGSVTRSEIEFYVRLVLVVFGVVYPWIYWSIDAEPFTWLIAFLSKPPPAPMTRRLPLLQDFGNIRWALFLYWLSVLVLGINVAPSNPALAPPVNTNSTRHKSQNSRPIHSRASKNPMVSTVFRWNAMPNIIVRKYYHVLVLILFIPGILLEPYLVALAFTGAMAIFIAVEYLRICRVRPLGPIIHDFMKVYIDKRDAGTAILTHMYLLFGCALPVWLHLPVWHRHIIQHNDNATMQNMHIYALPALAGVLTLGAGDAAASVVGTFIGKTKWPGINKSVEGTLGGFLAILATVFGISWLFPEFIIEPMFLSATMATCLLEAFTSHIDNLFLPLYYYAVLLLSGMGS